MSDTPGGENLAETGVAGLDEILHGGLPRGHLYLVEGDPGAGKTTLALQFLLRGLARGEKGLYVTLSETRTEVEKVAASHGWKLTGLEIQALGHSVEAALADEQYTVFRPSDIELVETTKKIVEMVERLNPNRVVIDSLSELRLLAHEPLRYRRQILGLKQYFASRQCTVVLLDDRTVQTSDLQPQSIAHGVIEMDRMAFEYGAERRRLRVAKLRGLDFLGGYHDFTIRTGGVVVFPRISGVCETKDGAKLGVAQSGMRELDELLGGGLERGTSTLLTGPAGTGKSTLAMLLADAACKRGEKTVVFAFEESEQVMLRRASTLGIQYAEHLRSGRLTIRRIQPAELSPGEFADLTRRAVETDGASMVVIDSLNGYLNAMPEERFLTAQLHDVLAYLGHCGVVSVMVLAQRGMAGPGMTAPVDVSYLADTVIMMRHFEAFGAVRKAMSVLKKRTGTHEDTIRELRFDNGKITVGKVLSDFRGVLTGVPVYTGTEAELNRKRGVE